ncbi:leucine-rich repeat-containing protein 74A [Biomphalaria glabrata]|nr:leucine-rich repeat-containing protein 74A-like [Biomphalaria glabrata]
MKQDPNPNPSGIKKNKSTPNFAPSNVHDASHQHAEPPRQFLVTHTSDNWKIRKAAKQAALEAQKRQEEEMAKQKAASESRDTKSNGDDAALTREKILSLKWRRQSADDVMLAKRNKDSLQNILSQRKKSLIPGLLGLENRKMSVESDEVASQGLDILEEDVKDKSEEEISSRREQEEDDASSNSLSDNLGNEDDDRYSILSDTPGPSFLELNSDDFDTDLSDDEDAETEKKHRRKRNKTLENYKTACAKLQLKPNQTFLRQCGRPTIDIRNRMLTHKDAKPIAIALVDDTKISFLDISDNPLGPAGLKCISEMLTANESIVELNLSNTQPGREGLAELSQALSKNKTIRRVYLDSNTTDQADGDLIAELITEVPDLRELYISNNCLGFSGGKKIAGALASDKGRLSVLDLQYNHIRTDSAVQIALALAKNSTLRTLNLAWNGLGTEGCRALARSLEANSSLTELDLTCNRLGIKSLEFLLKGIIKNRGLTTLKIGNNPLTTQGVKALLQTIVLAKDSELTHIDLQGIPIDTECLKLIEKLKETRNVQIIYDPTIHIATVDQTKEFDGTNLDRFDPVMVMFEYMKKDNLRVIDLFQFMDAKKREKLSRNDIRSGFNILMIPFTEHAIDVIMEKVDTNRDGYITLEEMTKAYRENDRTVKLRRIRANKKKRKDQGLEDLWKILKELIAKRKAVNDKRAQAGQ